jgi:hypothetical protein
VGGAAGHMNHPFDLGWVNTGSDLIDFFERAKTYVEKKGAGSVKIDGVNVSFKVVETPSGYEFAVDRGSLKPIDIEGITMDRVDDRFPEGHGMRPAIKTLLSILNEALPAIKSELETLGMWDNPAMFLNTEYVEGTTNVTEYDENFLAIHGLNQFYHKIHSRNGTERPGAERPEGVKAPSAEVSYDPSVMDALIKKLNPIANEYGFQVYGSVPTERSADVDIDFSSTLSEPFTVRVSEDREITKSLQEWLSEAGNPRYKTVKLKNGKKTHPLHKELYKTILDGNIPIVDLIEDTDAESAIYGAIIMHATRLLGNVILQGLTSPMGDVMNHEGVVLRDEELFGPNPVKVTGEFILGGMGSGFQADTSLTEEDEEEEPYIDTELVDDEDVDPVVDSDFSEKTVAIVPGAFKPPHIGHAEMVKKYLADGADRVIILVSQPTKSSRPIPGVRDDGLSPEDSIKIWEMLVGGMPGVEIEKSPMATPISAAYALVDKPAKRMGASQEAGIEPIKEGDTVILGASTKNDDWKRWSGAEQYVSDDLKLVPPAQSAVAPSIHSTGYMGLLNMSPLKEDMPSVKSADKDPAEFHASDMRYLIEKASEDEEAIELLEDFIGEDKVFDLLSILGLDTGLNEMSAMASGAVQGSATGAKGGPWNTKAIKKYNKKEKEDSKLIGRNLALEENIDLNIVDDVIRLIMEKGIMQ